VVDDAVVAADDPRALRALNVMDDDRSGPAEERWNEANTFARVRRCERDDMLWAIVAQIMMLQTTDDIAGGFQKPGAVDFAQRRPTGRPEGGGGRGLARSPQGPVTAERLAARPLPAAMPGALEDLWGVGP
jgi:hypothetical protein